MNFYDVLAAEKWGGGIPSINFFDLLFAQSMGGGEQWKTYEGTLPATINANGADMLQYQVYGAAGGVGDRTINYFDYTQLIDGYIYDSNGQMILNPDINNRWRYAAIPFIQVTPGATYLRTQNLTPWGNYVNYYDSEKNFIERATPGVGAPFIVPNNCHFITFIVQVDMSTDRKKYMLTEGATPPASFVPFGYEVPINVKSGNIFDIETAVLKEYWINDEYDTFTYHVGSKCYFIPASGNESYTITDFTNFVSAGSFVFRVAFTDKIPTQQAVHVGHTYRKQRINSSGATKHSVSLTNNNYNYLAIQVRAVETNNITVSKGTTSPDEYQPYSNTTIPIYIGDDQLDKDEYIDYQAGKVFRRTENKYDIATQTKNSGLSVNGSTVSSTTSSRSDYIAVAPEATYTKKANVVDTVKRITQFFDSNKHFLSNTTPDSSEMPQTFTTPNNCAFVRIAYPIGSTQVMLVEGSDAPAQFVPYLQPTDPPVALPALPTCEGETIVDYAGSGTAPEKVLLEYKKGGN